MSEHGGHSGGGEHGGHGGGEHQVRAVLNIGGEVSATLKSTFNLVTGNIGKIGKLGDEVFRKKLGSSIRDLKENAKDLTKEISKTGDATGTLGRQVDQLNRQVHNAEHLLSTYHRVGKFIGETAKGFAVVSAEVTATSYALYHFTEKYDEYVKEVATGARVLSLTTEEFSKLKYAAGDNIEAVSQGFKLFEKNIDHGSKGTIKALSAIGLSYDKLRKKSYLGAYLDVAEALKNYKGNKTAKALDIFGKGGAASLPMLLRGRAALEKKMAEIQGTALLVKDEDAAKMREHTAVIARYNLAINNVTLSLGKAFLPAIERTSEVLSNFLTKHNKDITEWASKLGQAVEDNFPTVEKLEDIIHSLGDDFDWFKRNVWPAVDALGGCKLVLGAIVAMPFLPAVNALLSIGTSVTTMGAAGGLVGLLSKNIGSLCRQTLGLAAFGVQLGIVAEGFKAIVNLKNQWDENKGTLLDKDAWAGYFKGVLSNDPILRNLVPKSWSGSTVKVEPWEINEHSKNKPTITGHGRNTKISYPAHQTNHVTINVNGHSGMDAHAVASLVMSRLAGVQEALTGGQLYEA